MKQAGSVEPAFFGSPGDGRQMASPSVFYCIRIVSCRISRYNKTECEQPRVVQLCYRNDWRTKSC